MIQPIFIIGSGAVTPVGLTALQTCAAIRARVSGFRDALPQSPPEEPVIGAIVPARRLLKQSAHAWLVNLAVRALRECLLGKDIDPAGTALFIALPEVHRNHPAFRKAGANGFLQAIEAVLKLRFHPASAIVQGGSASALHCLVLARQLFEMEKIRHCIVGGVDSLINTTDVSRLRAGGRLYEGASNPQGLIPGEGAAFLLLATRTDPVKPLAQIVGIGSSQEQDGVLGERYSTGTGLRQALENAVRDAQCNEADISFRVSDMNGERYRAWESMLGMTRFYRTRREQFCAWYPATSVGDIGVGAGALTLLVAATGLVRGYAPGPFAMCEAASDEGLRAACIIAPAPGAPAPPFRSKEALS